MTVSVHTAWVSLLVRPHVIKFSLPMTFNSHVHGESLGTRLDNHYVQHTSYTQFQHNIFSYIWFHSTATCSWLFCMIQYPQVICSRRVTTFSVSDKSSVFTTTERACSVLNSFCMEIVHQHLCRSHKCSKLFVFHVFFACIVSSQITKSRNVELI